MTTVATLTIEMAANVARLRQDMGQVRSSVDTTMSHVRKSAEAAAKALATIGVGLSVAGLMNWTRQAINAADETSKLAQRVGLLTKEVAGLQLAFRQAGAGDQMQQSLARLSREAAGGSKALAAMGVSAQGADGSLKSTRQLLGEVAERFSTYRDGAEKTALAQQLFGKSGAELIPLLNAGAGALDEYDAIAKRLGLTLDEQTTKSAERFNDQMDLAGQRAMGVALQVATGLLPVLEELSKMMADAAQEGSNFESVGEGVSVVLETIAVIAVNTNYVLQQTGETLGALIAGYQAFFSGNFEGAREIGRQLRENGETARREVDATTARILNARRIANSLKGAEDYNEPAFRRLLSGAGDSRSAAPIVPGAAQASQRARAAVSERDKLEKEHSQLLMSFAEAEDKYRQNLFKKRLNEQEKGEKEHSDWLKSMEDDALSYKLKQHEKQLDAQEKAAADVAKAIKDQAEAEQKAYTDMWMNVEQTARSVFIDVADGGEDAFERIGKTLKAAVLDMLWQMTARKWIFQIAGVDVGGMAGGGGGGGSNLSSMYSAYNNFSAGGGGNMGAATGWATGGMSTANALGSVYANTMTTGMATGSIASSGAGMNALLATNGAYGTAAGAGTAAATSAGAAAGASAGATAGASAGTAGAAAGLAAVPVWGWIALAVLALWEPMFGRKTREIGMSGKFDGQGGVETQQYKFQEGGWFRSDKTSYSALNDGGAFANQLKALQTGAAETARVLGLSADAVMAYNDELKLNLKGLNPEEAAARTKEEFTKLQAKMLATASFVEPASRSLEGLSAAALEMGLSAEESASYIREAQQQDAWQRHQAFEQLTNGYVELINRTEQAMAAAGITAEALSSVLVQGMTGRLDESQVGAQLADIIIGGIYNTIAGGFAAQISQVFMQQIIQPIMVAVTAGVPITSAISQQAIATVVATAQSAAAQLSAIFSDPGFRAALDSIQQAIGGISAAVVKPARHVRSFGTAALAAGEAARQAAEEQRRAAEAIRRAWQQISDSITEEIRRIRGEILGPTTAGQAYAQAQFAIATAQARAGDQEAAKMLPELSRAVLDIANQTATSLGDLRAVQGATLQSLSDTRQILSSRFGLQIPAFAAGGMHGGGWAMVGERGPELAYMPPARIYNASDTNQMLGGDPALLNEVRGMRLEMEAMRRDMGRTADNTGLTSQNIDDAVKGRRPIATREVA